MESENLNTQYWLCNCGHLHIGGMYPHLCTCDFCGKSGDRDGVPQHIVNAMKPLAEEQKVLRAKMRLDLAKTKLAKLLETEAIDARAKDLRKVERAKRVKVDQHRNSTQLAAQKARLEDVTPWERAVYYRTYKPKLP
jgi:hypothetical protein